LHLDHHSLYEILQILSLSMFETIPINQLLTPPLNKFRCGFRVKSARSPLKNVGTLEAVKAASTPEIESLRQQLRLAQTPAVPAAAKVIRLRHIAGQWSTVFSSKTACSSGCSHCCHLAVMVPRSEAKLLAKVMGMEVTEPAAVLDLEGAK
jgi:hypothetical protein